MTLVHSSLFTKTCLREAETEGCPLPAGGLISFLAITMCGGQFHVVTDQEKQEIIETFFTQANAPDHPIRIITDSRPTNEEWAVSIKDQCDAAGSAFFFKQWGTWGKDMVRRSKKANGRHLLGKTWDAYPERGII